MFKLINKLKNRKGFTLVELIVVLAVLGVIMAIAVPRFTGVQEDAKEDSDLVSLEMVAKAAELYYIQENLTETDTITIETLIDKDYIDGFKMQSKKYKTTTAITDSSAISYDSDGTVKSIGDYDRDRD